MRSLVALMMLAAVPAKAASSIQPDELRCEYRRNPLGIDAAEPRLSWIVSAVDPKARGLRQTAYQILVAGSDEALRADKGDLWDSGRVASDQSIHVPYRGNPLPSGARAVWKVRVWDQAGNASTWSRPAFWSMGLLKSGDWKAKWIGRDEEKLYRHPSSPYWNLEQARWIWAAAGESPAARFFRAAFSVPAGRKIARAIAVIGADSQFEFFLNGERIGRGSHVQMPEVFEVTERVREGQNAIAVRASARKGRPPGLIGALRVEFAAGEPLIVRTGGQWRVADAQPSGWEQPAFDDSRWTPVKELGPYGMMPWGEVGFSEERVLPARMLRKEFDLAGKVKRATAFISGLGLFELYLNGVKVGDHVLSPGLTDYEKRVFYVTADVTSRLAAGRNAIGVLLGNGRFWAPRAAGPIPMRSYGYPKALVQLEIEYENGRKTTVVSDETWRLTTAGPIRANNEFDGEEYDARLEMQGWSRSGFSDAAWEQARAASAPPGILVAEMAEPLRVTETLRPIGITQPRPGVWVFDMGQNMVGWCRLRVSGPRGARITLRHAETLRPDGNLYVDNLRSARAADVYILKGGGSETWEPRFIYHGFRYVEMAGYPGKPPLAALEGRVVHDDMTRIADFSTSNSLLNQIHKNIFWGVRGNYRSIPTDCPQRDERQGWLGDRSMVSRSESYLFDVAAFYSKWMTDLEDSQRPSGSVPNVAPAYWVLYSDNITWPSTFIFIPGMLYEQYGDRQAIARHYPAMKKWIDYMRGFLKDDLMPRDTYGDWCVPPEDPKLIHSQDPKRRTDATLLGSSYYYHLLRVMARYARLLDKPRDASDFETLASRVRAAFQMRFFKPELKQYDNGTQTSSILPLYFGMSAEEDRKGIFAGLIDKIERQSNGHIGTGLVGAQWLMRTLSDNGRADVAYAMANQKTYPGWGYMIEKGATTIWELWNGDTADPAMNSGNHVMQIGDLGVWFYEYLAGIRPDPEKPGFKHVIIRPFPVGDLSFVKASHRSMYGTIVSHWRREGGTFQLDVVIPPNTTATVYVPAKAGPQVHEVGSGTYSFRAPL